MADDRTPKVTPHLLERGLELCPRRLALELDGAQGDAARFTRWRVRSAFVDAASLAHRDGRRTTIADFPSPPELLHEEVAVWERAATTYVRRFGEIDASAIDHGCEQATLSRHFGVRVGGAVDVLVDVDRDDVDGHDVELRQFELWGRPVHADPWSNWEIALAVLRLARLLPGQRLRICHVDLLGDEADLAEVDYETDLVPLRDHFGQRLDELRARADSREAVPGTGCGQCRHIAGCPAHKEVA